MTPDELNRFVHEKIMGLSLPECDNCGTKYPEHCGCEAVEIGSGCSLPDYTQWEHYGPLLENVWRKADFAHYVIRKIELSDLLNPPRGLAAICEFFREK